MNKDLPHTVLAALKSGNKIESIKLLRSLTGLGLKEAKELVDAYQRGTLDVGQAETRAKAMVETIGKEMPVGARSAITRPALHIPHRHPGLGPGEVPHESSAQWIGLVLVVAAGAAAAYLFM